MIRYMAVVEFRTVVVVVAVVHKQVVGCKNTVAVAAVVAHMLDVVQQLVVWDKVVAAGPLAVPACSAQSRDFD